MSIYQQLGVPPIINAAGMLTRLSGTLMLPEVRAAMDEAAQSFVIIAELQEAAGRVIAEITGAESGYVTAGSAAGLTLAAAACLAGTDADRINCLPDTSDMPNQIVIPGPHRDSYDRCFRAAGARIVTVGTPEQCSLADIEAALGPNVVAVALFSTHEQSKLPFDRICATAHAHNIPVIIDAAYGLPPVENLTRFIREGADLVVFSGGKALRGPQASGILAGRANLIRSVAMQHQDFAAYTGVWASSSELGSPGHGIGRAMKVGKEEIVGAIVALRQYAVRDAQAERAVLQRRAQAIQQCLANHSGIIVEIAGDADGLYLIVQVEPTILGVSALEIADRLCHGTPRIIVLKPWPTGSAFFEIDLFSLQQGEAEIVGERIREELDTAMATRR